MWFHSEDVPAAAPGKLALLTVELPLLGIDLQAT